MQCFHILNNSLNVQSVMIYLTSPKDIQIDNDTWFSLINLLDSSSLKYPLENVYQTVVTMYEIFRVYNHPNLTRRFYEGLAVENLFAFHCQKLKEIPVKYGGNGVYVWNHNEIFK